MSASVEVRSSPRTQSKAPPPLRAVPSLARRLGSSGRPQSGVRDDRRRRGAARAPHRAARRRRGRGRRPCSCCWCPRRGSSPLHPARGLPVARVEPGPLVVAAAGGRTGPGDAGDGRCSRARWPPGLGRPSNPVLGARRLRPRLRLADLALGLPLGMGIARTGPWLADKTPTETLGMLMGGRGQRRPLQHGPHDPAVRRRRLRPAPADARRHRAVRQLPAGLPRGWRGVVELLDRPRRDVDRPGARRLHPGDGGGGDRGRHHGGRVPRPPRCPPPTGLAHRSPRSSPPVFFLGPGALAIGGGIANFAVACGLTVAVGLPAAPAARVVAPLTLAAIGGAIVGVAATWVLLLALAGPALLLLLLLLRRRRWMVSRAHVAVSLGIVGAVAVGLAHTAVGALPGGGGRAAYHRRRPRAHRLRAPGGGGVGDRQHGDRARRQYCCSGCR